jgi:hypothetical protein
MNFEPIPVPSICCRDNSLILAQTKKYREDSSKHDSRDGNGNYKPIARPYLGYVLQFLCPESPRHISSRINALFVMRRSDDTPFPLCKVTYKRNVIIPEPTAPINHNLLGCNYFT